MLWFLSRGSRQYGNGILLMKFRKTWVMGYLLYQNFVWKTWTEESLAHTSTMTISFTLMLLLWNLTKTVGSYLITPLIIPLDSIPKPTLQDTLVLAPSFLSIRESKPRWTIRISRISMNWGDSWQKKSIIPEVLFLWGTPSLWGLDGSTRSSRVIFAILLMRTMINSMPCCLKLKISSADIIKHLLMTSFFDLIISNILKVFNC